MVPLSRTLGVSKVAYWLLSDHDTQVPVGCPHIQRRLPFWFLGVRLQARRAKEAWKDFTLMWTAPTGRVKKKPCLRLLYFPLTYPYVLLNRSLRPVVCSMSVEKSVWTFFSLWAQQLFHDLDISCGPPACPVQLCLFSPRRQPVSTHGGSYDSDQSICIIWDQRFKILLFLCHFCGALMWLTREARSSAKMDRIKGRGGWSIYLKDWQAGQQADMLKDV